MELWIRSQDKSELVEIDNLFLGQNDLSICTRYKQYPGIMILGRYISRERSLEVLNAIQESLIGTYIVKNLSKSGGNMNNVFPILVYEMPKE